MLGTGGEDEDASVDSSTVSGVGRSSLSGGAAVLGFCGVPSAVDVALQAMAASAASSSSAAPLQQQGSAKKKDKPLLRIRPPAAAVLGAGEGLVSAAALGGAAASFSPSAPAGSLLATSFSAPVVSEPTAAKPSRGSRGGRGAPTPCYLGYIPEGIDLHSVAEAPHSQQLFVPEPPRKTRRTGAFEEGLFAGSSLQQPVETGPPCAAPRSAGVGHSAPCHPLNASPPPLAPSVLPPADPLLLGLGSRAGGPASDLSAREGSFSGGGVCRDRADRLRDKQQGGRKASSGKSKSGRMQKRVREESGVRLQQQLGGAACVPQQPQHVAAGLGVEFLPSSGTTVCAAGAAALPSTAKPLRIRLSFGALQQQPQQPSQDQIGSDPTAAAVPLLSNVAASGNSFQQQPLPSSGSALQQDGAFPAQPLEQAGGVLRPKFRIRLATHAPQ